MLKKSMMIVFLILTLTISSCSVRDDQNESWTVASKQKTGYSSGSLMLSSTVAMNSEVAVELIDSTQVKEICDNAEYVSKDIYLESDEQELEDGLTVLYGSDLDVSTISKFVKKPLTKNKADYIALDAVIPQDEYTNVYMVMRLVYGGLMDVKIISVSYSEEVDLGVIERFVKTQIEESARTQKVKAFINDAATDVRSVLHRAKTAVASRSSTSSPCVRVYDQNQYIDNYIPLVLPYPVIVYQKDITYEAIYIPDSIEDSDSYIIVAYVYVTPGNQIASPTKEIYNDKYGDRVKIRGAKTEFHNLFPDDCDKFITMSPNNGMPDVNGENLDCKISYNGEEVAIEFSLTSPDPATISMDTFFDSDGVSYVEFMASSNKRMADKQFFYATAMYMESGGDILYTRVATGITYRFNQYGGAAYESDDRFTGSGRDIYYEKN